MKLKQGAEEEAANRSGRQRADVLHTAKFCTRDPRTLPLHLCLSEGIFRSELRYLLSLYFPNIIPPLSLLSFPHNSESMEQFLKKAKKIFFAFTDFLNLSLCLL